MTRPRVDPDKRQRTAQACDSCKRRKQKCNGLNPCNTCSKRSLSCTYGSSENGSDEANAPSPKRRLIHSTASSNGRSPENPQSPPSRPVMQIPAWGTPNGIEKPLGGSPSIAKLTAQATGMAMKPESKLTANAPEIDPELLSRGTTVSGHDEEAVVYSNNRMLQDPTGRLLYIGDSATLSFLQLIRMIVENVAGPSPFTMDPRRHMIVENVISLPHNIRRTHLLPDKTTALVLVEAFFTNTNGLVDVFPRKTFMSTLDACYTDPLNVNPSWLCLLYLTFAIGLVMATPTPGTGDEVIIQKLRSETVDRAEIFYTDSKTLADPSTGFEDAGFWSVQALTLISVYMLAVSKRNAAYAYYGMAVRSAFALGLHREETMCIFGTAEQIVRRNLWRSLFVLDRFLSASLGRPTAIRESDCSGDTLTTGEKPPFPQAPFPTATNMGYASALGLEASVRSCHVVGVILEKVYSKRKISTKLAQEIADHCKGWPKALDASLHWRQAVGAKPNQGVAILHVNLLYCHSIILLTRPFFLFLMNKTHQQMQSGPRPYRLGSRLEKFADACVIASCHTIQLVQNAFDGQYLPHRNPFVIYFLFAAALVALSNEFSSLFYSPNADAAINKAINLMHYCAQHDPQASRLLFILTSFRDVVIRQRTMNPRAPSDTLQFAPSQVMNTDPPDVDNLFQPHLPPPLSFAPPSIPKMAASSSSSAAANLIASDPALSSPHPLIKLKHPSQSDHDPSSGPSLSLSRHNSLDAFFGLAHVTPHSATSNDGNESAGGDAEIDFEMLWHWPGSNRVTPGGMGGPPGGAAGLTSDGGPGGAGAGGTGSVPLYGMAAPGEFTGEGMGLGAGRFGAQG